MIPARASSVFTMSWYAQRSLSTIGLAVLYPKIDLTLSAEWDIMETITTESDGQSRSLKIFIVEDHVDTLAVLTCYLESLGHAVTSAKTMAEAFDIWPLAEYDLLISDLRLPDGDGWELLQRLPLSPPIYAVAISGFGMAADHARSVAAGYRQHLLKPFKVTELEAVLHEAAKETASPAPVEEAPAA